MTGLGDLARWYAAWMLDGIRQTWEDMPGPAPVKIALVAVCVAIPGPQDELLLLALTRVFRAWHQRQATQTTQNGA